MPDIGTSFQPGQAQQNGLKSPDQARQEAVRVLSLRLPKVMGGSPLAPAPLLTSLGSAGGPTPGMSPRPPAMAPELSSPMPPQSPSGLQMAGGGSPMAMSPMLQALGMLAGLPMPGQGQPQTPHITPGVLEGEHPQGLPPVQWGTEPTSAPDAPPEPQATVHMGWLDHLRQKYDAEQQANSGPQIQQGNY